MIDEQDFIDIKFADCCQLCTRSPFVGKRITVGYCKKVREYVTDVSICKYFDLNTARIRKKIGGLRASITQKEKLK